MDFPHVILKLRRAQRAANEADPVLLKSLFQERSVLLTSVSGESRSRKYLFVSMTEFGVLQEGRCGSWKGGRTRSLLRVAKPGWWDPDLLSLQKDTRNLTGKTSAVSHHLELLEEAQRSFGDLADR